MQVTELESKGLYTKYKITIDSNQINSVMEAELKAAGEKVKIPGFRPGYIPMKVLQQRYGKSLQGDVMKRAINEASTKVVTDKKLRPAVMPKVNIEDYKEGGDLVFNMEVESFPTMPEIDYSTITLNRKTFEVSEKDVDEAQARIADRNPSWKEAPEGTKAALGNTVTIDFKGMVDGIAFPGGTAEDFDLELGSKQFIDTFEEQLVGKKAGDETLVKVTFPENYGSKDLAGKKADFEVKVKTVKIKESSTIDDEFAKARGFESLANIRDVIKKQLTNEYDQVVRNALKKDLFDVLEKKCDFELPQSMVDMEFNSIWERLQEAQKAGDESVAGKSDDELRKEYQDIARRRVKLGLLLAEIGNNNKIQITREELTRAMMQQASMFPGQEKMVMDFYRQNPDRVEDLRGPILEEKAVDFVLEKVKYNDKKVPLSELVEAEDEAEESESTKKPAAKKKANKE